MPTLKRLGVYLLVFFGLHVWVVLHEEPAVHTRLGEDWKRYVARAPRWISWRREAGG